MAKNDQKKKSGLHKEISSIFDGIPVPSDRTAPRPQAGPQQSQAGYDSPRPPANAPQNPQIPGSHQRSKRPEAAPAGNKGALQKVAKRIFGTKQDATPARQKMMMLLMPLLLVVFVVMLGRFVDIPFLTTKEPVAPEAADSTPAVAVSSKINWQKPVPYPAGLRDPMQLTAAMTAQIKAKADAIAAAEAQRQAIAAGPEETEVGELTVKGILFSIDKPSAVIGTRIAHAGDVIAGATIVKINKNSVDFERDGETWTQTVEP